jgi:hypothetical protein
MTLQGLIDHWRKQVSDTAVPYLWDDDEALLFAIDAQDMFVRKMGGISDETVTAASDPTNLKLHDIALVPNVALAVFSPYILRVRSAKLMTQKWSINFISEADVGLQMVQDYGFVTQKYLDDTDTGIVTSAVLGLVDGKVRWWRVPLTADTCRMHIYRLPFPRITTSESSLEIDEQHHLALVRWMNYLAYSKEDAETYDKQLADKNEASFLKYCDDAKAEKDRQRFKPRIVQYGGY